MNAGNKPLVGYKEATGLWDCCGKSSYEDKSVLLIGPPHR